MGTAFGAQQFWPGRRKERDQDLGTRFSGSHVQGPRNKSDRERKGKKTGERKRRTRFSGSRGLRAKLQAGRRTESTAHWVPRSGRRHNQEKGGGGQGSVASSFGAPETQAGGGKKRNQEKVLRSGLEHCRQ